MFLSNIGKNFSYLSKLCAYLRRENKDKKTIVRFSGKDLEVLVKDRRIEDNYRLLPLEEIEKLGPIPKFDHTIVWKKRMDKPPRRQLIPVTGKIITPSIRQTDL